MSKARGLVAGAALALMVATPAIAAPERVEQGSPPPAMLNGDRTIRHQATPPHRLRERPTLRRDDPPAPATAAAPLPETDKAETKAPLDHVMAASDAAVRAIFAAKAHDKHAGDNRDLDNFYAKRNYAPLWIRDGELTAQAKTAIARLKNAANDGLDPIDYPVPEFGNGPDKDALSDLKLTVSVLTFARHLEVGRIAPTRVTSDVDYGHRPPEPAELLRKIADSRDLDATFDSFNPPHEGFRALKAKLAELRANSANASADESRIPDGPAIKPGARDARVPKLRERLGLKARAQDTTYDKALYNTIRHIQQNANLKPTGVIDNRTLAAINGPSNSQAIDRVLANMERWRWLPRDLGRSYVIVNIPDYSLKVVNDHRVIWRTKIVAGKPATPTPLVTASMDQIIVNPSWYVPQSIIQNELLPLYASDPNIFDRMGLEVKKGPDGHINVVQPPGAANALGQIKFNFPNKFQVYLHDTPEKKLFSYDRRAFSHGCMRVENPTKFGEVVMAMAMTGPTPSARQIDAMFGHEERDFKLVNRPMVHLTYQTAFVDDNGKLVLRDDLYGFDARIRTIMHSDERRIADIAPPPDPKRDQDTAKANQEILRRVERREAGNPFVFFERLFR